jgi:CheY-specific phosphatase CheX
VGRPDELVGAFAAAVPFAVREMAGVEAASRDPRPATAADRFADVSVVVRLTAAGGEGQVVLSFPPGTAAALARRVLAGVVGEPDGAMVRDCMGEVANVAAGQAKVLLVGTPSHFTLSPPTAAAGGPADAAGWWVIGFDSDVGEFAAHLRPPPADPAGRGGPSAEE